MRARTLLLGLVAAGVVTLGVVVLGAMAAVEEARVHRATYPDRHWDVSDAGLREGDRFAYEQEGSADE